jgi:hypothetical protein
MRRFLLLAFCLAGALSAQITRDNFYASDIATGGNNYGCPAISYTMGSGPNGYMLFAYSWSASGGMSNPATDAIPSYNGVAMTLISNQSVSGYNLAVWGLANPTPGTNNLTLACSSPLNLYFQPDLIESFTHVYQAIEPDAMAGWASITTPNPNTLSITTNLSGDWLFAAGRAGNAPSAGTGAHFVASDVSAGAQVAIFDSNGTVSPGANAFSLVTSDNTLAEVVVALCVDTAASACGSPPPAASGTQITLILQ